MRLDDFLAYKIARLSRTKAVRCIKGGAVAVDPFRPAKPALRLHVGDSVRLSQTVYDDTPDYGSVVILDETADYWVFDKPAGMAVHPTAGTYNNTLTRYIETRLNARPYVVHRLDRETSGVIVVAKSPESGKKLDAIFLAHDADKIYTAVAYDGRGNMGAGMSFDIDIPLGPAGLVLPRITMGIGNLDAVTHVHCESVVGKLALCRVAIDTGRQHQIRVHMALSGSPIIGDKLYFFGEQFYKSWLDGEDVPNFAPDRQLLHASRLSFYWNGTLNTYESPQPRLFGEILRGGVTQSMFPTDYSQLFRG